MKSYIFYVICSFVIGFVIFDAVFFISTGKLVLFGIFN